MSLESLKFLRACTKALAPACYPCHIRCVTYSVEYSDDFGVWWESLSQAEQESVAHYVKLLETTGPLLPYPYSSGIVNSKHGHMRELRVQHQGEPYRVFYAFDPRRVSYLIIGGCKTGNGRFYDEMIPKADEIYDLHIKELKRK